MKRVSFALMLTLLVLSFGLANAQFSVDFSSMYTETAGTQAGNQFLNLGAGTVTIYHDNGSGVTRTGWSTPFAFTGTATLSGPMTFASNPDFDALWTMGVFTSDESWDGDLSVADQYNYSGISLSGYGTGMGNMWLFTFDYDLTGDADCEIISGTFCVDSGDFTDPTYDWLFDPQEPWGLGTVCYEVKKQCNENAYFTNCPVGDVTGQWSDQIVTDLDATENEGDMPYAYSVISHDFAGTVDIDANGVVTVNPTCDDVGSHSATFGVRDAANAFDNECTITYTIGNTAPTISGDCGAAVTIGTNTSAVVGDFDAADVNTGDVLSFSAVTDDGTGGSVAVDANGVVTYTSVAEGVFTVTVTVTDCNGEMASCDMTVTVVGVLPFDVVIEKVHGQLQGHHAYVDVDVMEGTPEIHGFDFLIGYDASALTFISAELGAGLLANNWEYFTYRYSWNGNCGGGCPSGLLRAVGMAETNNGDAYATIVPGFTGTLFTLDFLVTNDRTFECMFAPIYFYWMDCGDNTIAFLDGTNPEAGIQTAVSSNVYWYGGPIAAYGETYSEVTDMMTGFPTFMGAQEECFDGTGFPNKPIPADFIEFFGGGIDIICADSIDARGDVNLNGIANEIADAVVFTNYFIYGLSAFDVSVEGQIAATEINGDGIVLSVADLVYLIRVIVGDALALPKLAPAGDLQVVAGKAVTMNAEVGAAYFVFDGEASVELGSGAEGMELKVGNVDGNTVALVYTMEEGVTAAGEIIVTDGNLASADVADYNGNTYATKLVPAAFALDQNYPNPFNPNTVISMALPEATNYSLSIYNVAGQKVQEYNGFSEAGTITFDVDMSGFGSGIYFYKADAGEYSATKKMVLLK